MRKKVFYTLITSITFIFVFFVVKYNNDFLINILYRLGIFDNTINEISLDLEDNWHVVFNSETKIGKTFCYFNKNCNKKFIRFEKVNNKGKTEYLSFNFISEDDVNILLEKSKYYVSEYKFGNMYILHNPINNKYFGIIKRYNMSIYFSDIKNLKEIISIKKLE